MWRHLSQNKTLGFFLVLPFLISGCDSKLLNQTRQVSVISQQLKSSFPVLANDYVKTCYRRASYGLILTNPNQDPFSERKELEKLCSAKEEVKQAYIYQNEIISSYLDALGTLARAENFSFDVEVSKINDLFKKQFGEDLQKYNGGIFNKLLLVILKTSTQQIASKEIKIQVTKLNPDFQKSVCIFKNNFREIYKTQLDYEKENLDEYYTKTIKLMIQRSRNEFQLNGLNIQRLRQILYRETPSKDKLPIEFAALPEVYQFDSQWREKETSHQIHYQALNTYIEILNSIASGHAALDKLAGGEGLNQGTFDEECKPSKEMQTETFETNDGRANLPTSSNTQLRLTEFLLDRLNTQIHKFQTLTLKF
jgi:hypothetical protein